MVVRRVKGAGAPADAPHFTHAARGGWLSRLVAKFEAKNRKPDKSAPVMPLKFRSEHGGAICRTAGYLPSYSGVLILIEWVSLSTAKPNLLTCSS